MSRFNDRKLTYYDFSHEFLVECPNCSRCAKVMPNPNEKPQRNTLRRHYRLVCESCGYHKETRNRKKSASLRTPSDVYFHQPLWLSTRMGKNVFWAFNREHLDYIEAFVSAKLRGRNIGSAGCLNCSIISRLPLWIKQSSNRQRILKLIRKLKLK